MMTLEQRKAAAARAWETMRARKAGTIPPAPDKKTSSKDEQLDRLRAMMKSWLSGEPVPEQVTITEAIASVDTAAQPAPVAVTIEVPVPAPAEPPAEKKPRRKKAAPVPEAPAPESEAPAAPLSILDAIVDAQEPAKKGGRSKKAA